jgi:ribonuclease BN (tRNA processing enzyme)
MHTVRIDFLGTGDAFFAGGRHQAAYLIESPIGSEEGCLLLDCGATALASLNRRNLRVASIDAIFLSHLHGDHIAGLPFLLLHYIYREPRRRPLKIIGPPGAENRVRMLFRAMYADVAAEPLPFKLEFLEASPKTDFSCGGIRIRPFAVPHQEQPISLGCKIEAGGRKIVYSGDSGWTEDLIAHTQNADLFICECSYFETRLPTHIDYLRIAENLDRFGAKRIILTHLGEEVLKQLQKVKVETAHDNLSVLL